MSPTTLTYMRDELRGQSVTGGPEVPFPSIPDSDHHIMFDQPLALIATLNILIAEWRRSDASVARATELSPETGEQTARRPTNKATENVKKPVCKAVSKGGKETDFSTLVLPSNADLKVASKL